MHLQLTLTIVFLSLTLCGCKEVPKAEAEQGHKLHAAGEIAVEIEQTYKIKGHPYYRIAEDAGQIELLVSDPELDHQSIAKEISNLKSVRGFDGNLYVVFRYPEDETIKPTMWVKYDAKTGKQISKKKVL